MASNIRLSKSLARLRDQVNKFAPKRSKASDGWLGDSAHSMRKSDHNPEPDGTVDALDITHDPKNGVDIQKLCDAIIASKDRRVSYLICNGQIISGATGKLPWAKRKYTGTNKHNKHLHVSIVDKYQDDTADWNIAAAFGETDPTPAPKPKPSPKKSVKADVLAVQKRLNELGYPEVGSLDGVWGTKTRAAVLAFRADHDLPLVGEIDEKLLAALMVAGPREIAPARANATAADLRQKGAEDVRAADVTQIAGGVAAAGGGIAVVSDSLDKAEEYSDLFKRFADILDPIKNFIQDNVWLILLGVGAVVVYQAYRLKAIRLAKHQTGQDVSA